MLWLKARLKSLYHEMPASCYPLALLPAWLWGLVLTRRDVLPGLSIEWLAFVLAPAIAGTAHVAAPRASRGGRWYWVLGGVWLGAAIFGALAHWRALDPYTPWLSLARYALIAAGVLLFYVSSAMALSCFGKPFPVRKHPTLWKAVCWAAVGGFALAIAYLFYLTPFQLALAPRHRTATTRRLHTLGRNWGVLRAAWSPGGRHILIQTNEAGRRGGVLLIEAATGHAAHVARDGAVSDDRPWLPGGDFLMLCQEPEASSIWRMSPDGRPRRLLRQEAELGAPTCSPDGARIAFTRDHALWVAGADGSAARLLVRGGTRPRWSPDGTRLLFCGAAPTGKGGRWEKMDPPWRIVTLSGQVRPLPLEGTGLAGVGWLDVDTIITADDHEEHRLLDPLAFASATVKVWDTSGRPRRSFHLRTLLGLFAQAPAIAPDRHTLALPNNTVLPASPSRPGLFLLDTASGRLVAVPPALPFGAFVWNDAWSPDGHSLLFVGADAVRDEFGNSESQQYLGVIEGL